jgi:hypothetical protein
MVIDYSAYAAWMKCPAYWYELYVNKRRKAWKSSLRDDALCLGSLVHAGLEVWQRDRQLQIPQEVVDAQTPTAECLRLAEELVWGYVQVYPEPQWALQACEEPLLVPMPQGITLLAKVDHYFYVPEPTQVEVGLEGEYITLAEGWWVNEYKTKNPYDPTGIYMQQWETGAQASFQTLALRYHLQNMPGEVQGVLVNVLEKPRVYIPKRKCKGCEQTYEFATYVSTGKGTYKCPQCYHEQVLTALKEAPQSAPPKYYRFPVYRRDAQLMRDAEDFHKVGMRMKEMEVLGIRGQPWSLPSCVDMKWKRECDFFLPHTEGLEATEAVGFIQVEDYRGLKMG